MEKMSRRAVAENLEERTERNAACGSACGGGAPPF